MRKSPVLRMFCLPVAAIFTVTLLYGAGPDFLARYKGVPYHDGRYRSGPQQIPGRVVCAYYDLGGEGVAYHDTDPQNHGSGELNPLDGTYLNEFRKNEGVDTSYTKFGRDPQFDDNPFEQVKPPADLPYVGWTEPGEWFNLTVEVREAGEYAVDLLYTSNRGGTISFDVNGDSASAPLTIVSTYNAADPLAWRQWHHWNIASNLTKLKLPAGKSVLTLHVLTQGQMNFATLDFRKAQ